MLREYGIDYLQIIEGFLDYQEDVLSPLSDTALPNARALIHQGVASLILTEYSYRNTRHTQQTTISQFFHPVTSTSQQLSPSEPQDLDEVLVAIGPDLYGQMGEKCGKRRKIPSGGKCDGKGEGNLESILYIGSSTDDEDDEEHATCIPAKWKTMGVNSASEYLLR
ncbi:hypothetical protein C7212DRAFT_365025 [Tuber magnatum]|uniref:Uncharacterized protein n=1 Tax=Tuber magnatum TaxID=42249 RepID=A0A317SLT6_9PEZI|nr:hypothetical protein C7212DRAFT_365025 [Tuber magnatum]